MNVRRGNGPAFGEVVVMSTGMEVTLNARYGRNPYARKPRMRMFLMSIENHSCSIASEPNKVSDACH